MNTISKASVAGALALGFGVAHASILEPASPGDIILFAEVLNSSGTVVGSYAGDSGIQVGSTLANGTVGTLSPGADTNLNSLLTVAESAGSTIEWAVEGANVAQAGHFNANDQYVTTVTGTTAQLALRTGTNTLNWSTGLKGDVDTIDGNNSGANSIFSTSIATGGLFNVAADSNIANWYANGTSTAQTGLGTGTELYKVTVGSALTSPIALTGLGTVTLSKTGLSFAAGSGGGSTVPLPAAVWLLGSGLLGLAGVGRRKSTAA